MKTLAFVLAAWLAGAAAPAAACGFCIEDRIAAAYDHAVVARAKAQGHEVVYVALDFAQPASAGTEAAIRKAVESMPFVDRGSVRVSRESGSLSLAFDPRRAPAGSMLNALDRAVTPLGASVSLLRIGSL